MLSLYEILKASKTGIAPDLWTALAGKNWNGSDSGHEIKELTGIPPLSFRADGTPLLDFLISGNMVQSGTPSSSSIIMPQETGDKTGNLYNNNETVWVNDVLDDNGQSTGGSTTSKYTDNFTKINANTTYYHSGTFAGTRRYYFYDIDKNWISRTSSIGNTISTFTTPANCAFIRIQVPMDTISNNWCIVKGSTALPYEPYGYKIPILSGGTTTPVYLGLVQSTRRIKKLVLTGNENFSTSTAYEKENTMVYYTQIADSYNGDNDVIYITSSHYQGVSRNTLYDSDSEMVGMTGSTALTFRVSKSYASNKNLFLSYLAAQYAAGTPVTVWYVLATPTTGVVNEPIRKIGNYADTLSMEQAGVSIPTLNGQTVVDVDTTLKPSEMYIKYQG